MAELALRHDEQEMVHQIHKIWAERESQNEANRVYVGKVLRAARVRVERGEFGAISWWDWYKKHFERSRRDAERLLEIAGKADPVAAHEEAKAVNRASVAKHRASQPEVPTYVSRGGSGKPVVLTVVSAPPQDEPGTDDDWIDVTLAEFTTKNLPTQRKFIAGLRRAYREGWK